MSFKYSVAEFNKSGRNRYIRFGYKDSDLNFNDCVAIKDGELVGIILGQPVECPVSDEVLGKYFGFEGGVYTLIKTPKTLKSTAELRRTLYNDGFVCNGVRYVRWKRSSGSSRVGKCLFIDEKLYARMHKWEMCGLKVAEGEEVDLAALESYISLPSSSIIDILEINPENILVIDDYESKFFDRVMSVSEDGDHLIAEEKDEQITNSIWDGQGLIDISAMGKYSDKGMILLRNLFFKCCCFNTNLQQWFADHGITEVSQLKGYTKAMVKARDGYTCAICKGRHKDRRLDVHHIIFRSQGGSDEAENLITLCHTCHKKLHDGEIIYSGKGKRKGSLSFATQMNSIRKQLLARHPEAIETFGYITSENCQLYGLPKAHCIDAVVIASDVHKPIFATQDVFYKRCIAKGTYQCTKGVRSEKSMPKTKIAGFKQFDKVKYQNNLYFIKGRMSVGYAVLSDIYGTKINFPHMPKLKEMQRIAARKSIIYITAKIDLKVS